MSIGVMDAVWKRSGHKGTPLLLMLALADWSHDDGSGIRPSVASMAKKTRLGERAIQYVLKDLLDSGELRLVRKSSGKPGDPNHYAIMLEKLGAQTLHPSDSERMQGGSLDGRKMEPERVNDSAPKPLVKPSVEPSTGGERLSVQELCAFLLPIFHIPAGDMMKLGFEVQHDIGKAHITRAEAEALVRFYKLPADSRHPEVKSRKQKLSRFMPEYREQIALALKICPPRPTKPKPTDVPRGTIEARTSTVAAADFSALRKSIEEMPDAHATGRRKKALCQNSDTAPPPAPKVIPAAEAEKLGYKVVAASGFEVGLLKNDRGIRTWYAQDFDCVMPTLSHPLIMEAIAINEEFARSIDESDGDSDTRRDSEPQ